MSQEFCAFLFKELPKDGIFQSPGETVTQQQAKHRAHKIVQETLKEMYKMYYCRANGLSSLPGLKTQQI